MLNESEGDCNKAYERIKLADSKRKESATASISGSCRVRESKKRGRQEFTQTYSIQEDDSSMVSGNGTAHVDAPSQD